jgi:hypothetical protein
MVGRGKREGDLNDLSLRGNHPDRPDQIRFVTE